MSNIDLDALVSAVVAKTDSGNRVKKEFSARFSSL